MQQAQSSKFPVIVRPGAYIVYFEWFGGRTWIHCDILARYTPTLHKELRAEWDQAFKDLGLTAYACNQPTGCKKHQKFMKVMGFEPFEEIPGPYYIYRRENHG